MLVEDYHTFLQSKLTKESLDEILIKLGCGISQSFDALIINVESLKNSKLEDKVRFFYEANHKNYFGSSSYVLSVLLFNYLLIQDNELPIIMYPNIAKHIMQTFKETPIEVYKILIQKLINQNHYYRMNSATRYHRHSQFDSNQI